jgi:hypothetical protein
VPVEPGADLRELAQGLLASDQPFVGSKAVEAAEAELTRARAAPEPPAQILQRELGLAELLLGHGRVSEAIELLEGVLERASRSPRLRSAFDLVRLRLASAHLRRGVIENDLAHHDPESSIYPIRGNGVWGDPSGADAAIPLLREVLEDDPKDTGARWLLGIAHMEKGTYPDEIPRRYRVPLRSAASSDLEPAEPDVARFTDVAAKLGLDVPGCAGGVIVDDFEGNGTLDIVTTSMNPSESLRYYHGDGHGGYEDWTERAGLAGQTGAIGVYQADYDNNGLLDLFLVRGAWLGEEHGKQRKSLLRQENDLTFTDVTLEAGLASRFPASCAGWADYDLDGMLDLYVGNEGVPCELFRNGWYVRLGDVAQTVGVGNRGTTKGVAWGDFDNDGDPDLYVSNYGEPNSFYLNELRGRFASVAATLGVALGPDDDGPAPPPHIGIEAPTPRLRDPTFATWFFDYDNDGWLDLFVAGYDASLAAYAADHLGEPTRGERIRLFRNGQRGNFHEVAADLGLARVLPSTGGGHADLDNDGFLDLVLGTGWASSELLVPNVTLQNLGGRRFVDATAESGLGHLQPCGSIACGDLDNDGDPDVVASIGGPYPAQGFPDAVFQNPGHGGRWITLVLRSAGMNHLAFGARVRVDVEDEHGVRSIHRVNASGAGHAGPCAQLEIGLGAATRIVRVGVRWPGLGAEEVFEDLPLDSFVRLTQGQPAFELVKRWPLQLGAKGSG